MKIKISNPQSLVQPVSPFGVSFLVIVRPVLVLSTFSRGLFGSGENSNANSPTRPMAAVSGMRCGGTARAPCRAPPSAFSRGWRSLHARTMHLSQGNRNLLVFPQPQQRAAGNWGGSLGVVSHASSSSSSSRLAFSRRRIPAALNHAQQQQRNSSQRNLSRGSKSCLSAIPSQHHNPALGYDLNDILHTSTTTSKHQTSRKEGLSEVASSVAAAAAAAAVAKGFSLF